MPKPQEPIIETIDVTPKLAAEWLTYNSDNRPKKVKNIAVFADAMKRGQWRLNGETIKFVGSVTSPKKLLDGQNRLHAVVAADVAVPLHIAWRVDESAQETMDVGVKRTLGDVLSMSGEKNATTLAAAIPFVWRDTNRRFGFADAPTITQARLILESTPGLRDSVAFVLRSNRLRYPGGLGAFLHYRFAEIDAVDSDVFWHRLLSGVELEEGDPIWLLREACAKDAIARPRMPKPRLWAITVKAWNAWRDGSEIKMLKFTTGGSSPETFPEPR